MLAITVGPAVRGGLHARRARLHVILRIEMTAGCVGRPDGVNRGEASGVPERLERRELRMQPEMPVEVHEALTRDGDAGPLLIVLRLAVGDDHAEPVDRAALKQADQGAAGRRGGRAAG
jgi:hypothetical protein